MANNENQEGFDYSEFGNDAGLIEKIMKSPAKVKELLDQKRAANEQAKEQRLLIKSIAKAFDQTEQELAQVAEVYEGLKSGQMNYNQLDEEEQDIALLLVGAGSLDPNRAGVPEEDIEDYYSALSDDSEDENENRDSSDGNEVAQLKRELYLRELADELKPANFKTFKKLWEDPDIDERLPKEKQDELWNAHIEQFRTENEFLFGANNVQKSTQEQTQQKRISTDTKQVSTVSQKTAALENLRTKYNEAKTAGKIEDMLTLQGEIEKIQT